MAVLKEGDLAPDFELESSGGKVRLKDLLKENSVILYFYPKDMTPGCTQEACDFRDAFKMISAAGAAIVGVSADSTVSHDKFKGKYGLPFVLLSDESKEMLKRYGVWKEKSLYGRKFMGIERTTVVIDRKGRIRRLFPKVKVKDHVGEVLAVLKEL
jgi:thioredoxin-dependent peroxiredoxin